MIRALALLCLFAIAVLPLHTARADVEPARDERARALYFRARADHAAGRHQDAVRGLQEVMRILGTQPRRVLPLLVDACRQLREHTCAEDAAKAYLALTPAPDPALAETVEMTALRRELAPLAAAQRALLARTHGNDLTPYRDYLARHPHGDAAREVKARLQQQEAKQQVAQDDAAFARARAADTPSARPARVIDGYEEYLRARPNGRHVRAARERIAAARGRADDVDFGDAASDRSVAAYERYLRRWPRGRHVDQARAGIASLVAAERRAEGARLLRVASTHDATASRHRTIGALKLVGGLVLAGGGVTVAAVGGSSQASFYVIGGMSTGIGLYFSVRSFRDFSRASAEGDTARSYRQRAAPLLQSDARPVGLSIAIAF